MQTADLLTPTMIETVLPLLGFSLILNVVLLAALMFRPVYRRLLDQFQIVKIGVQMVMDRNDRFSQHS